MNKTDLLFQMMEQPHAYTDQQWQDILSDEECRELYTLMAKTQRAFDTQNEIDDETIDVEWKRLSASSARRWLRVAAMFIGVLMISGMTIAAVHLVRNAVGVDTKAPTQETPITDSHQSALPTDTIKSDTITKAESVVFDNVTLDSIARDIAAYHHLELDLQNEQTKQLRFYFVWKQEDNLQEVIEKLNMFEHVNMTVENDKLMVR